MARASFLSVPQWSKTLIIRFSALWIALIVALVLPPSREMLRFHIVGSEIVPQLYNWGQPWVNYQDDFDLAPLLKKEPKNPALALWDIQHQAEESGDYYEYDYYPAERSRNGLAKDAARLVKRFPDVLWLRGYAIRTYMSEVQASVDAPPQAQVTAPLPPGGVNPATVTKKTLPKIPAEKFRFLQESAKLEPQNAFWLVCEAYLRIRQTNFDAAQLLLTRAAKCSVYDDKSLEAAREVIHEQMRHRSLSWEEKKVLYEDANEEAYLLGAIRIAFNELSIHSLKHDLFPQKLQTFVSLMRVGRLLQEGNNSLANCNEGIAIQQIAWRLANPASKRSQSLPDGNRRFVALMKTRGYPELAKEALQMKRMSAVHSAWIAQANNESWGFSPSYLDGGGLATRANLARDGGIVFVGFCGYLMVWWAFLNVFLFRGQGLPSTRRERIVPVVVFGLLFLALAGIAAWWFSLVWNGTTPRSPRRDEIAITVGIFAFFGLPIVLAVFCALATIRRFKSQFSLPPRVDTELQLTEFQRNLLWWMLPAAVICSIGILISGWLLLVVAVLFDWGRINVLAWLPPDSNGLTPQLVLDPINDPVLIVYGLLMCAVCLGVWFLKWRYFSPKDLKVFTHTGLRRWKETVGIAIIVTIGIYIVAAVAMWPTRRELDRRMEKVLALGPLSQLPKDATTSPE